MNTNNTNRTTTRNRNLTGSTSAPAPHTDPKRRTPEQVLDTQAAVASAQYREMTDAELATDHARIKADLAHPHVNRERAEAFLALIEWEQATRTHGPAPRAVTAPAPGTVTLDAPDAALLADVLRGHILNMQASGLNADGWSWVRRYEQLLARLGR